MVNHFYVHLLNDFSGSPLVLSDFINASESSAHKQIVFTSQHEGFLDNCCAEKKRFFYFRSSNKYAVLLAFSIAQAQIFFLLSVQLLLSKFRGNKSIVVVNTMLPSLGLLAGKLFASQVICYVHETTVNPPGLKAVLRWFVEHCAHHVLFVSNFLKKSESFKYPVQHVMHNGLRRDFPVNISIDRLQKHSDGLVVFVGSLKPYKGIAQLLDIARQSPDLNFFAALNSTTEQLATYMEATEVPENLVVECRPPDINKFYQRAFVVMNLSLPDTWIETFAMTLLEGMHYGCAVVAPPVGGHLDYVTDKHGLLCNAVKTYEISAFLKEVKKDREKWLSYSHASSSTAAELSHEKFAQSAHEFVARIEIAA